MISANPRQLLASEHVNDASAAEPGYHRHNTSGFQRHFTDYAGLLPEWVCSHTGDKRISYVGRNDRNEFAFVGDVQRISKPESNAR